MKLFPSYFASAVCGVICMPVFLMIFHMFSIKALMIPLFFSIVALPSSIAMVDFNECRQSYRRYGSFFRMKLDISFFIRIWLKMGVFFLFTIISVFTLHFIMK